MSSDPPIEIPGSSYFGQMEADNVRLTDEVKELTAGNAELLSVLQKIAYNAPKMGEPGQLPRWMAQDAIRKHRKSHGQALLDELAALRAMPGYAVHQNDCQSYLGDSETGLPCDCGLDEARAELDKP